MFLDSRVLFIYAESPIHAGTGTGLGAVDLPIQRDRLTSYPIIQASSVKGALRSATAMGAEQDAIFGPEGADHAGAISASDARTLLFPVRSLKGIFAYTTCMDVLERFLRDLSRTGMGNLPWLPSTMGGNDNAYLSGDGVLVDDSIVLEEFAFKKSSDESGHKAAADLADWLAANVFSGYSDYWQKKIKSSLVILPNDAFRDFTVHATEVVTRIKIDNESKTVAQGALWTQELLPTDSILYSPVYATKLRMNGGKPASLENADPKAEAAAVLNWITTAGNIAHNLQIGGDETVGRGLVRLQWMGGA